MNQAQLAPVAEIMLSSYMETATQGKQFLSRHDYPLTSAAKAQYLRSVVLAEMAHDDGFQLSLPYIELGRVEFTDCSTKRKYLLRSDRALRIERTVGQNTTLFSTTHMIKSDVVLLVYKFHNVGLDMSVAGTKKVTGFKLAAAGVPTYIGTWPYSSSGGDGPFEQGKSDSFTELGDIDLGEEGEG